ncbi:SCO family protein [Roseivivax marinus]|uniref:SCO family protein n=1 Tax=Roseivivax marinus TaxID=1379903 RepID=UPI001F03C139|nr:SCO family protein [Roseivivax marinus]UMA64603.1 SCO family protein [Roseivivax marinus]
MRNGTTIAALAAGAALLGIIGGTVLYSQMRGDAEVFADCRSANVAGGMGAIGGDFELVSETGETVTSDAVFETPSLVYFGYTFCPDVCPLDNQRNAQAADVMEEMGYDVQPVFITVDPARDTPEVMAEFTDAMHPDMLGLTGSEAQVKAAADAYRVYYRVPETDEEYYLVDHTTFTYLVLPEAGVVDFFKREDTPEGMAERAACFIDAAGA